VGGTGNWPHRGVPPRRPGGRQRLGPPRPGRGSPRLGREARAPVGRSRGDAAMTGVPPAAPATVPAAVRRAARLWPHEEAIVDGDRRLAWAALAEQVTGAARAYAASGVAPGDRVVVWAPNSLDWIVAALGAYAAGAVLVPVNTRFKGREAAH